MNSAAQPVFEFEVEIVRPGTIPTAIGDDEDLSVRFEAGRWVLERGDFHAELDPALRHGRIWQSANPYAIDAAFRIVHSLLLAKQGGLLVHAASVVRNGRAFLFAGVSGAGKTTISRLAPPDATLLTDEISYLRREPRWLCRLRHSLRRRAGAARARMCARRWPPCICSPRARRTASTPSPRRTRLRAVLRCILFFAHDSELVGHVFDSACHLVQRVPVRRLTFVPDSRVWELIV